MSALNEIIWKSVRGADSEMPLPVHRYWFAGRPAQRQQRPASPASKETTALLYYPG
jgi:hypothetical protein